MLSLLLLCGRCENGVNYTLISNAGCVDFSSHDLFDELAMCSEPLLDEFMESGELTDAQDVYKRQVDVSSLGVNDAVAMLQTTKKAPSYKDGTAKLPAYSVLVLK